ncbi:PepSY domain-containing protein [Akkermansiaceae bacterium]|nr:PepSY domain-containing protein [Akkermansiaceae bacterium]MDA7888825.1 PepSY domain-containing protein [Akkermansiaceae bacterium]
MSPEQATKRRRRVARQWHRWLGLAAALPLLWLSVTGLLLNHIVDLGLNDKRVSTEWVLRHYHQLPEGNPVAFKANERLIVEWDDALYLDGKYLEGMSGSLIGAVGMKSKLVIASRESVGVFDESDGMELDLDELSLPPLPLEGVAVAEQAFLVKSDGKWWWFSDDFLSFEEFNGEVDLLKPYSISEEEMSGLKSAISSSRSMPLDRVIGDAHSGKLFGWPGWLMTDLAAVGVIILTVLGLRLFPKRKP